MGQIAFYKVNTAHHYAEIEYCIGQEFQHKGYVTEANRAIMKYGFEQIGLNRIQISHRAGTLKSSRVIDTCGFTYEGTSRRVFCIDGEYVDRLNYAMLAHEWEL